MDIYELNLVLSNLQEAITDLEKALVRAAKVSSDTNIAFNNVNRLLKRTRSEHERLAFILSQEKH